MADNLQNKKVFFIPGWLDVIERFGYAEGWDIWLHDFALAEKKDVQFVIAYSLGANFVLAHQELFPQAKFIFVNPLFIQRSFLGWFWQWLKYIAAEGPQTATKKPAVFLRPFANLRQTVRLLKVNADDLLDKISADRSIVVRGKGDQFFCDEKVARMIRQKGVRLIEAEGVGHNWKGRKFNEVIDELIEQI